MNSTDYAKLCNALDASSSLSSTVNFNIIYSMKNKVVQKKSFQFLGETN